jgi:hypothetical protein
MGRINLKPKEAIMVDDVKKPDIKLIETPPPESVFDDVEALRKVATLKVSRRVVPVNVKVGRPANNVFFRSHADMVLDCSVLIGDGGSDDFYFVVPRMLNHPTMLPRLRKVTIATIYTWPGGAIGLWPVPLIEERSRIACWRSARAAFELSKKQWVQLCWNSDTRDYDVVTALEINNEPQWPADRTFSDLLRLGFADKIIDTDGHPYVMRLRGIAG